MFLNPIFLWAALAGVVPLVLHLMQRKRIVLVRFSTIRFLKLAERRSANRVRLENFLLWLLRTLLVLLLAAGFAMPMLRTRAFAGLLGGARRDVAIVLDASYSMRYATAQGPVWNRALDAAAEIVRGLEEGDQVAVFLAADTPRPVVEILNADRNFVLDQLRGLKAGTTTSAFEPALLAARTTLLQEKRRREREIHILTDGQALPWMGLAARDGVAPPRTPPLPPAPVAEPAGEAADSSPSDRWNAEPLGKAATFFVTVLGPPSPENFTPSAVRVDPPLLLPDTAARVTASFLRSGPPRAGRLALSVDGRETASRPLPAQASGNVEFVLPRLEPGVHTGRIHVPPDPLSLDDEFHFLVRVKRSLKAVCVGAPGDVFFLTRALNPAGRDEGPIRVQVSAPGANCADELGECDVLFLCNALPLPGQAITRIERYVREGGLAVFFPGDRARLGDYAGWACLQDLRPVAAPDAGPDDPKRILNWANARHPVLSAIPIDAANAPVVTILRSLQWPPSLAKDAVLVRAGAGQPFLLGRAFGRGQVLLFAVSADRSWSNLPLSPFFLPLMHQIAFVGAGVSGEPPHVRTTRSLSLTRVLRDAAPNAALLGPDGERIAVRRSLAQGTTMLLAEDVMSPGIYRAERQGSGAEPVLAVNVDRSESDLARVVPDAIAGMLGSSHVIVSENTQDLQRRIRESRVGRTFGEAVLWLAFAVALAEVLLANRKARPVTAPSGMPAPAPSGRLAPIPPPPPRSRGWLQRVRAVVPGRVGRRDRADRRTAAP